MKARVQAKSRKPYNTRPEQSVCIYSNRYLYRNSYICYHSASTHRIICFLYNISLLIFFSVSCYNILLLKNMCGVWINSNNNHTQLQ